MDETELQGLIQEVKQGRLSRRHFVQAVLGLGLTAPMAAQMLASAGVASAEPRERGWVPSKRGGGGELRILMWDGPTQLNPHFGRGLRDFTAGRMFYEPLAAATPEGTFVPVLAEELPSLANGGVARDGQSVTWRLKKNLLWHDGKPFTADDVIFNWEFAIDPANATSTRAGYLDIERIDRLDSHTVKLVFKKPQPFWQGFFTGGGIIPRHVFAPLKGPNAREAAGMARTIGTGPYRLVDFKPGDFIRAELNPAYHVANRPFFDRVDIKCGGDSTSAARAVLQTGEYDFAYYLTTEEEMLKRIEVGGKGRVLAIPASGVGHIQCNQTDPWREVDGERSSLKAPHPFLTDATVRAALGLLVDRASIQEHIVGRSGQITSNFLNAPERFRSRNTSWEFSVDKANALLDQAGWARGADGVRTKDGKRLKMLFQSATAPAVQKVQAVMKQAAARAGIEIEVKAVPASVFFSADTNNLDTNVRFIADLQMYTTFTGLDPQHFMAQFLSTEIPTKDNKWSGRNMTRWQNAEYDALWNQADVEMDPVKRTALFIRMNDLVIQSGVVIPVTWRNIVHAAANSLNGIDFNGWDSIYGRIAYWHRQS
jgi:peptide/nickel transport system substrate-binding protein